MMLLLLKGFWESNSFRRKIPLDVIHFLPGSSQSLRNQLPHRAHNPY
jgi:hypothetical protein